MSKEAVFTDGNPVVEFRHVLFMCAEIRLKLEEDLWQTIIATDTDECGCVTWKTQSEVVARIKFTVVDGICFSAHIRTDLLAKYQAEFSKRLPQVALTFERLQPYLAKS